MPQRVNNIYVVKGVVVFLESMIIYVIRHLGAKLDDIWIELQNFL